MKWLVLACLVAYATAIPIDNGVEGDPEIECGPTNITVNFNTQNNFQGHVYVKGLYANQACRVDASGRQVASISLPFDSCNVQRTRSLNPKGVFVSTTVVISFHPNFITKVDRAYTIQCFYMEADKTVSTEIEVSMLTTGFQSQLVPMPICRYEIRQGGPTGDIIQYALVGDQVYHKWICDSDHPDTFCMYVYSCYVDDGAGDRVDLLDESGCALDKFLLNNLEYPTDLMGGVEAHVFKYADRAQLYFTCQIQITVKEPNGVCNRPQCSEPAGRGGGGGALRKRRQAIADSNSLDVRASIDALELEDGQQALPRDLHHRARAPHFGYQLVEAKPQGVCLSSTSFATFLTLAVALIAAVLVVSITLVMRRGGEKA